MIRVLIERHVAEEMEESYRRMLHEVRREAVHAEGYISGETLRDSTQKHRYVIISTWRTRRDWDTWAASRERTEAMVRMAPLLAQPESVVVLEPI
jgi:heme-degrading monooxygenase HmoA